MGTENIRAVSLEGFLTKIHFFILALQFKIILNWKLGFFIIWIYLSSSCLSLLVEAGGIEPPSENGRCSGFLQAQPVFGLSPAATPQAGYLQASPVSFRKMPTGRLASSYPVYLTPFPSPRASLGGRRCVN